MSTPERDMRAMPCQPPVAGACVASQQDLSMYDPMVGIRRGTVFSYLDLPWKNEINQGTLPDTVLNRLMAVDFALHEFIMFLDTHPKNEKARATTKQLKEMRQKLVDQYEKHHGPLTARSNPGEVWVSDPWPWQTAFNEGR